MGALEVENFAAAMDALTNGDKAKQKEIAIDIAKGYVTKAFYAGKLPTEIQSRSLEEILADTDLLFTAFKNRTQ